MITQTKTRRWGNSLGIIIPQEAVRDMNLKTGEQITIEISKRENVLKELFGSGTSKKDTSTMIKEVRGELESKWIK